MRLRTLGFIVTLALGILLAPVSSGPQQPAKVFRMGILSSLSPSDAANLFDTFRRGLRELGYVEGQNIVIEHRYSGGKAERLPDLAADLVRLNLDVILTVGPHPSLAASKTTRTIPIVFVGASAPVESGLVASLARPGGNITGLSFDATPELAAKRLELLSEVIPRASRVAVLSDPTVGGAALYRKELEAGAQMLGLKLQFVEIRRPEDFESAFSMLMGEPPDALVVSPNPLNFLQAKRIADFAAKNRLLAIYGFRESVQAGGLMAYSTHVSDLFRRAATYVDKILKGAKPADLPVEQPTKFELVINLKTAKTLGLTIPQSVLIRADQVIE